MCAVSTVFGGGAICPTVYATDVVTVYSRDAVSHSLRFFTKQLRR